MANDTTYIKLFHKMLTWGWYGDTNTFRVFMHILLRANYKESEYLGHKIGAGECVFGYNAWSEELGLSVRQLRTAISHLKSTNEIRVRATNRFSVITVVKWEFWQIEEGVATTQRQAKRQASDKQATTSKEYKNTTTTPTIEEVRKYVTENNLSIDADYFWKYYETAEWKDAKGKQVKNWKLKALNWNRRENGSTNDDRRSNSQRNGIRQGHGRTATQTADTGKTVWQGFKRMEDVFPPND